MKETDRLRKAIIALVYCKTEAQAKKCAERIDTMILQIEKKFDDLVMDRLYEIMGVEE